MVKVCEEWYPKGSFPGQQSDGFYLNSFLKDNLDYLIPNIIKDWDFTIIISGHGDVRVGKSRLALTIGTYLAYQVEKIHGIKVKWTLNDNIAFKGSDLISNGHFLGKDYKCSPLVHDEAGVELQAAKVRSENTQKMLAYYRECGQYNLFNLIVIPDFFELPKGIAISRSICLLDVYYTIDKETKLFKRGFFKFYNKDNKRDLYVKGKKFLDYNAAPYNFFGDFIDFFPWDGGELEKYKQLKQKAILGRGNGEELSWREKKYLAIVERLVKKRRHMGDTQDDIAKDLGMLRETVSDICTRLGI